MYTYNTVLMCPLFQSVAVRVLQIFYICVVRAESAVVVGVVVNACW